MSSIVLYLGSAADVTETFQSIDLASDHSGDNSELVKERKSKLLNRSISLTGYAVRFRNFLLFENINNIFDSLSFFKIRVESSVRNGWLLNLRILKLSYRFQTLIMIPVTVQYDLESVTTLYSFLEGPQECKYALKIILYLSNFVQT